MNTQILTRALASTQGIWIVGPRYDFLWFIFPALSGFLVLFLNLSWGVPAFLLYWFWHVSANTPHLFSTVSRTYLDRQERQTRFGLLWSSPLLLLVGPASIALSVALGNLIPFLAFGLLELFWAYWHVVRQHLGFLALYQSKDSSLSSGEKQRERKLFNAIMFLPVLSWLLRYPLFRKEGILTYPFFALDGWLGEALFLLHGGIALLVLGFLADFLLKLWRNPAVSGFRFLLVWSYIPLHLFTLLHPVYSTQMDILLFAVVFTFAHNLQYQGLVWFHNQNKYSKPDAPVRHGPSASWLSRSPIRMLGVSLIFTILFLYPQWFFRSYPVPFSCGKFWASDIRVMGNFTLADFIRAFWVGFAFTHYWIDARIWRVRHDPELRENLGLVPVGGAVH